READRTQASGFHLPKGLLPSPRFNLALGDAAAAFECFVLKNRHGFPYIRLTAKPPSVGASSPSSLEVLTVVSETSLAVVTLSTSSTVVSPSRTIRQPSSASVFIPARRAAAAIWSVEALFRTSCRISESVSIHSKMARRPKKPVFRHSLQ